MNTRKRRAARTLASAAAAALIFGAGACSDESTAPTGPSPVATDSTTAHVVDNGVYVPDADGPETGAIVPATGRGQGPGAVEVVETPTLASTGLDRATLPPGMTAKTALSELQSTLERNQRSAARRTKPSKPEFTSVEVSAESVTTEWTESTAPDRDTIAFYELRFQALAGTGTDLTTTGINSTARSFTTDVDAGWYWVFIRAKGTNSGYSNSDFEFIEVPEGEPEPEPEPPDPPTVNLEIGSAGWTCSTTEYCTVAVSGSVIATDPTWNVRAEAILRPGGEPVELTSRGISPWGWDNLPLGTTVRLRGTQQRNGVWSEWSRYGTYRVTAEDAAKDSDSSVPGALSNLSVVQESGGYRVSFTRGSHGGLPITHYEWRPTDAGADCNGPGLAYQNLQALNDNLEQSFLVYGYAEELAIRARNAKGAGPCRSSPFPGRPPNLQVNTEWWTCSNEEYCFKTVIVDILGNTEYQVQIEERTPPSSTSEDWTREILTQSGVQRFIQIDDRWWVHARQRLDRNSPWSDWSETLHVEAPIDEAKANSDAVPPAGVDNLRATRIGAQTRIQFRRGGHGGLPITAYRWFFHDACSGEPLGEWIPANDNFEQSFILNLTGSVFSIRAKNAKGEGACIGVRVAP